MQKFIEDTELLKANHPKQSAKLNILMEEARRN